MTFTPLASPVPGPVLIIPSRRSPLGSPTALIISAKPSRAQTGYHFPKDSVRSPRVTEVKQEAEKWSLLGLECLPLDWDIFKWVSYIYIYNHVMRLYYTYIPYMYAIFIHYIMETWGVYGGGLWISLDKLWISQWWLCSARNVWRGWCVVIYCKIERYQDLARVAWARLARNKQARTKMQLKSPGIDSLLANAWPMYSR